MNVRAIWLAGLVVGFSTATACRDAGDGSPLTGPVPWTPQDDHLPHDDYYQFCRMFSSGATLAWEGPGWTVPCKTTVTAVPKPYFAQGDTQPITFTFSTEVFDVDFGVYFAGCTTTGMAWAAFDAAGNQIETGTWTKADPRFCSYSNPTGTMILGPLKSIRVWPISPMPPDTFEGRAIDFMMDFFTPCPPTGNPILDDFGIRKQLRDELQRSRPRADGVGKKEYGGYVYRRDDGTYFLHPANDLTATDCGFTIPAGSPPSIPGATYAGRFYHTHPSYHGERLYGCSWAKPGDIVTADRNPKHGGGSPEDWQAVDDVWTPGYIIDLDMNVYRLDPGTPRDQRGSHRNKWRYERFCLIRFS